MNTEIYAVGFLVFCIVAIIFATNRWPNFFENNGDDPPPML